MEAKKRTEIATLGEFGLIDLLTSGFTPRKTSASTSSTTPCGVSATMPP